LIHLEVHSHITYVTTQTVNGNQVIVKRTAPYLNLSCVFSGQLVHVPHQAITGLKLYTNDHRNGIFYYHLASLFQYVIIRYSQASSGLYV